MGKSVLHHHVSPLRQHIQRTVLGTEKERSVNFEDSTVIYLFTSCDHAPVDWEMSFDGPNWEAGHGRLDF